MTTRKSVRRLSAVPSTLRIPLAARASGDTMFPQVAVRDAYAAGILEQIRDEGDPLPEDRATIYGILSRTRRFRSLAQDFLKLHPGARIVNMGCGLSHYFQWLDDGKSRMTDADLPEVLELRHELLPEPGERHDLRELDLTTSGWWEQLGLPRKRSAQPVFLFTEGVLMYLEPAQVEAVLATFGERAPAGSVLAFDAMCWLAVGRGRQHIASKASTEPAGARSPKVASTACTCAGSRYMNTPSVNRNTGCALRLRGRPSCSHQSAAVRSSVRTSCRSWASGISSRRRSSTSGRSASVMRDLPSSSHWK